MIYFWRRRLLLRQSLQISVRWFSVVNQVIPRHSLFPRKTPSQTAQYQRHYSANWRCGAIFNSMLIIAIKTRSCSGRPILGRNNHPSFVAVAVLLEKKLIYKMAISRKKLLSLPDKAIYSDTFWGALSGKFLFETKHYKPQIWKNPILFNQKQL